jgi:hypothetical protein
MRSGFARSPSGRCCGPASSGLKRSFQDEVGAPPSSIGGPCQGCGG